MAAVRKILVLLIGLTTWAVGATGSLGQTSIIPGSVQINPKGDVFVRALSEEDQERFGKRTVKDRNGDEYVVTQTVLSTPNPPMSRECRKLSAHLSIQSMQMER